MPSNRLSRRRDEDDEQDLRDEDERPRRRRSRDEDDDRDERPSRRSRRSRDDDDEDQDERPSRRRRSRDEDDEDERPSRRGSSRRSRDDDDEDDDRPRRRRGRDSDEGDKRSRRHKGSSGFASYSQKRRSSSSFADEFKPDTGKPTLIKFLEDGPFDTYNQHWIEDGLAKGKTRHSFVCRDDEYFGSSPEDQECPLCDIGENATTQSLFNVLDLTNPRKPEVVVWRTSPVVTDKLARMAESDRTSPLDREDLYFEVTVTKTKNKTTWDIQPVKARDLLEDFDIDPFEADELDDFAEKKFDDRSAVIKVDSYDDLEDLADSLD